MKTALKRPIPPQTLEQAKLHILKGLSGLDYYEQRLVSRMLAGGVQTDGDRRCLDAIVQRHLGGAS